MNTNSAQIATALTTLSKRIDDVETPKDLLSVKLAPIFQRMADAVEQTVGRATNERLRNQAVTKLTERLEVLTTNIQSAYERVTDKEERMTSAVQQTMVVAAKTVELTQEVRHWTERFTEIGAKQSEIAIGLAQASEVARERDRTRDDLLRQTLDDATRSIGAYEAHTRAMLQTRSELFETELHRAERAFMALSNTLSEGASLLASELGRRE